MVSGPIRVVASADLGGLGNKDGVPANFNWTPPSIIPVLLPWAAVLLLLVLPVNRCALAWWVLVPLGAVAGLDLLVRPVLSSVPSEALEFFSQAFTSLAFGVAAMWLAAPYLSRLPRVGVFFLALVVLGLASVFAYACRSDWESNGRETFAFLAFLACGALIATLAMSLAALLCRKRYSPFRLSLWMAVFLAAGWVLIASPFVVFASVAGGGEQVWVALPFVLLLALLTFVVVMPFFLLAFVESHYRQRLLALWHLPGAAESPPPEPTAPSAP
jgi:hypothetical protein